MRPPGTFGLQLAAMDSLSPRARSGNMRRIPSHDTKPELTVRSLVHRMGFRFSLRRTDLPGKPDLAFVSRHKIIFVHGCFWHQHSGCRDGRLPLSRQDYWRPKLASNTIRDRKALRQLRRQGWKCLVVWECQVSDPHELRNRLGRFLEQTDAAPLGS